MKKKAVLPQLSMDYIDKKSELITIKKEKTTVLVQHHPIKRVPDLIIIKDGDEKKC